MVQTGSTDGLFSWGAGPCCSPASFSIPRGKSKLLKSFRTFVNTEFTRSSESNPLAFWRACEDIYTTKPKANILLLIYVRGRLHVLNVCLRESDKLALTIGKPNFFEEKENRRHDWLYTQSEDTIYSKVAEGCQLLRFMTKLANWSRDIWIFSSSYLIIHLSLRLRDDLKFNLLYFDS